MIRFLKYLSLIMPFILTMNACYYDKEEELYRLDLSSCDTTNVTYSQTISAIMQSSCNSCHSTTGASGGWITDNYTNLYDIASNGRLIGAVNQSSGYSPMPKGSGKLSTCQISQIRAWINRGSQNN